MLKLWHGDIGDSEAAAIAEALASHKFLQKLDLSHNQIGNAGASTLAEAVKGLPSLQKLILHNNRISSEGAAKLVAAMKVNKSLQILDLGDNLDCGKYNQIIKRSRAKRDCLPSTSTSSTLEKEEVKDDVFTQWQDAELNIEEERLLPIHAAVAFGDKEALEKALADANISADEIDSRGRTGMDLTALTGQLDLLRMIKEKGGIFRYKNEPRMWATARKRESLCGKYLAHVRESVKLDKLVLGETEEDELPLHAAIKFGNKACLENYLEAGGAAINQVDSQGRTAMDLAALTGQVELLKIIKEKGGTFLLMSEPRMKYIAAARQPMSDFYLEEIQSDL